MSELINTQNARNNFRFDLLVTTSAIVLVACVASVQEAIAADRPTVWIEGGWHFDSVTGASDIVTPPLDDLTTTGFSSTPRASNFYGQGSGGFPSFTDMEKALGKSGGAEGSISFQPKGSDWIFNVSGRYGRTHTRRMLDQRQEISGEVAQTVNFTGTHSITPHYTNYVAQRIDNTESHTILDFQVGKEVGIGLLGKTESVFSFGARYAQMSTSSKGHAYAAPGVRFYGRGGLNILGKYQYVVQPDHQKSATTLDRSSNFHGIGPSLSWSNTSGLLGDVADGQLAFDWGVNAAVLFGRQRSKVNYSTVAHSYHYTAGFAQTISTPQHNTVARTQSRRVTVPNLGGFAALSYRFTNAKLSAGYRADFFFGALDGGLGAHRSLTTGFSGPFATVSFGLGG